MTTAAESAKIIRTALKAQGISNRRVSVRAENYSMGSSIHVEIKDPTIALAMVKEIAENEQRIDRCELTGDILTGGNRFVSVQYSSEASAERAAPYVDACREAMEAIGTEPTNALTSITGTGVLLGSDHNMGFQLWNGDKAGMHVNTPECAARIVADYVDENAEEDAETASAYEAKLAADEAAHDEQIDATEEARDFDAYPALRLLA